MHGYLKHRLNVGIEGIIAGTEKLKTVHEPVLPFVQSHTRGPPRIKQWDAEVEDVRAKLALEACSERFTTGVAVCGTVEFGDGVLLTDGADVHLGHFAGGVGVGRWSVGGSGPSCSCSFW